MVASLGKTMDYLWRQVMPKYQALNKGKKKRIGNDFAVKFKPQQSSLHKSNKNFKFEEFTPNKDTVV